MKKKLLLLISTLLTSSVCVAQSTTVTATVTDTDGFAWKNGTYTISLVPNPNGPFSLSNYTWSGGTLNPIITGTLNSSGAMSQSVPSTTAITPSGSSWNFTICPNAPKGCFTVPVVVTGTSMNLTTTLSAAAIGPRFSDLATAYGYGTVEVTPTPTIGVIFFDVTLSKCNQYTSSSWASCGSVSGLSPGGTNPAIQYNNAGTFGGLPINQRGVLQEDGAGTNFYSLPYAIDATKPPYNAVCNGVTDDHVVIQAALDNNTAIWFPPNLTCNVGSVGLVIKNGDQTIYGNGVTFKYSGSSAAISFTPFVSQNLLQNINLNMTGSTGTPAAIDATNAFNTLIEGIQEFSGPTGYYGIKIVDATRVVLISDVFQGKMLLSNSGNYQVTIINTSIGGASGTTVIDQGSNVAIIDSQITGPLTIGGGANPLNLSLNSVALGSTLTFSGTNATVSGNVSIASTSASGSPVSGYIQYSDKIIDYTARTLANGTVATTQAANDNSTKIATTQYVDAKTASCGSNNIPCTNTTNTFTNTQTLQSGTFNVPAAISKGTISGTVTPVVRQKLYTTSGGLTMNITAGDGLIVFCLTPPNPPSSSVGDTFVNLFTSPNYGSAYAVNQAIGGSGVFFQCGNTSQPVSVWDFANTPSTGSIVDTAFLNTGNPSGAGTFTFSSSITTTGPDEFLIVGEFLSCGPAASATPVTATLSFNYCGGNLVAQTMFDTMSTAGTYNFSQTISGVTAWPSNIHDFGIAIKAGSGLQQTGNLHQFQKNDGTVLSDINNLGQFENALNAGIPTNFPASAGAQVWDNTNKCLRIWDGTNWICNLNTGTAIRTVVDTSTPISVSTLYASEYHFNENATAATAVTYNLPTAAAGKQFCFSNANNGSAANTGVLTIATSASGQFIIFTDGTLTATGGNVTSGGAAADAACVTGVDATHWSLDVKRGTWTKH